MQQIKFFKGVEADLTTLERDVNGWLKSNGVKVLNIFGNIAPQSSRETGQASMFGKPGDGGRAFAASDVFIAVLYETA